MTNISVRLLKPYLFFIEFITCSGFRICVKELFIQRFDPLTVSYAVLTGKGIHLPVTKLLIKSIKYPEFELKGVQAHNDRRVFRPFEEMFPGSQVSSSLTAPTLPSQHKNFALVRTFISTDICEDDWEYFNGYCYRKVSSCDSWSNGQGTCEALGANLPSIHSQEENVFVQSLHGGEHSWLGLSDKKSEGPEGNFAWSDGAPFDFNFWAQHQPKKSHKQNCVHTLGFLQDHLYKWKDVNCTECHRFTCKKGTT